jgi:hypothetical protein
LVSECALAHEARVGLAEDGVAITWDNLATCEGILHDLSDVILSPLLTKLRLEI